MWKWHRNSAQHRINASPPLRPPSASIRAARSTTRPSELLRSGPSSMPRRWATWHMAFHGLLGVVVIVVCSGRSAKPRDEASAKSCPLRTVMNKVSMNGERQSVM